MNLEALVVKQAVQIEELKERVLVLEEVIQIAKRQIICIGGPLNDNAKGYSKNQLTTFSRILFHLESV